MLEIPVYPNISSDLSFSVTLDNVFCQFRLKWNPATEFWMVNTYEEPDNGKVLHGLKIIPNYPFLHTYNPSFPGQILTLKRGINTSNNITYDNFGNGWGLLYLTAEEFETWSDLNGFQ